MRKLNPLASFRRGVRAHSLDAGRSPLSRGARQLARRKLSPSYILERLRVIDALAADGRPIADALRGSGVLPAEYEKWRNEYAGLLRTLGSLASPAPKVMKKLCRPGTDRPVRTVKKYKWRCFTAIMRARLSPFSRAGRSLSRRPRRRRSCAARSIHIASRRLLGVKCNGDVSCTARRLRANTVVRRSRTNPSAGACGLVV